MKIGILSDTHNHRINLLTALEQFRQHEIDTLIHCGDMTDPELAPEMAGFRVICAFGNGDIASGEIRQALLAMNPENYAGLVYKGRIGGARIAVTHGHMPSLLNELLRSGENDYVFKGHSHQWKDERIGATRLINPGALGGLHREPRQVCVLDLDSGKANFIKISE